MRILLITLSIILSGCYDAPVNQKKRELAGIKSRKEHIEDERQSLYVGICKGEPGCMIRTLHIDFNDDLYASFLSYSDKPWSQESAQNEVEKTPHLRDPIVYGCRCRERVRPGDGRFHLCIYSCKVSQMPTHQWLRIQRESDQGEQ